MGSRFKPRRGKGGVSSSESDVSDSEASRMKTAMCKIRLETHSCLALLFQVRKVLRCPVSCGVEAHFLVVL